VITAREFAGSEQVLRLDLAGTPLVVKLPAEPGFDVGETLELSLHPEDLFLFAADQAGRRIER
jgi:hypothetical protein